MLKISPNTKQYQEVSTNSENQECYNKLHTLVDSIGLFIVQCVSDLLSLKSSQVRFAEVEVYLYLLQQKRNIHVTVGVVDKDMIELLTKYFFLKKLLSNSLTNSLGLFVN